MWHPKFSLGRWKELLKRKEKGTTMKPQVCSMKTDCSSRAIGTALSQRRSFFDYWGLVWICIYVCRIPKTRDKKQSRGVHEGTTNMVKKETEERWRLLYIWSCDKKWLPVFDLAVHQKPDRKLFYFILFYSRKWQDIAKDLYCLVSLPNRSIPQDFHCPLTHSDQVC